MKLTRKQQTAIDAKNYSRFVVACPGSGKTTTMIADIESKIASGVGQSRCLVVTFTRLAAHQVKSRLSGKDLDWITVGTFHSICYRLMRLHYQDLGFSDPSIHVLDRQEQKEMVKAAIFNSRYSPAQRDVMACLEAVSTGEVIKEGPTTVVADAYIRMLKEANAVDYTLVPHFGMEAVRQHGFPWSYLWVDEVQDLDGVQWRFFGRDCMLFAVGDPDQNIYSWRGADVALMRYELKARRGEVLTLDENFRSGKKIVEAASSLIVRNVQRLHTRMIPVRQEEGSIRTCRVSNTAREVLRLSPKGSVAVLGRTHQSLRAVATALEEVGIRPVVVGEQEKLLERRDVRDTLAVLAFPDMPQAQKVAHAVWRRAGWSDLDIERSTAHCRRHAKTYLQETVERLPGLADLYNDFEDSGMVERLQWTLRYMRGVATLSKDDEGRIARLVARFVRQHAWRERTGDRLIAWLNTRDIQDEIDPELAGVQLMTIHAAKGLEFDSVVVVGLDDDTLPIRNAHKDPHRLEEERRLMFVAMTRAKDTLLLEWPDEPAVPSRFFVEAGIDAPNEETANA